MKIYIPYTDSYHMVNSSGDILLHAPYFNSIDDSIVPFLINWLNDSETIQVQTSGSTGTPSVIEIEKSAMRTSAELTLKRFNLAADDLIVNCLPVKFIAGKMMLIRAIVGNLKLRLVQPSNNPLKDFRKESIQFTALTPPQLESGISSNIEVINNIEMIIIGGAPISTSLQKEILELRARCYATYGMTETITHIAIQSVNHPFEDTFKALDGIQLTTIDDTLVIAADHLKDSPIVTNDVVKLSENGRRFKWLGRTDFVINSGGVKLFPESIEKKIQPYISNRILIHQQNDRTYGVIPILIIESDVQLEISFSEMNLNKIETPKKVYYVDQFVETENGKINRLKTAEQIDKSI